MPMLYERIGRLLAELSRHMLPVQRMQTLPRPQVQVQAERPEESLLQVLSEAEAWPGHLARASARIHTEVSHYYLFRYTYEVPEAQAGEPLMFRLQTGTKHARTRDNPLSRDLGWSEANPQFTAVVNGRLHAGLDERHQMFQLTPGAEAGEVFRIVLLHYSGHEGGDFPLDAYVSPLDPALKDLYYDLKVPYDVAGLLSPINQERVDTLSILNEALNQLDLRQPGSASFRASIQAARTYLQTHYYEPLGQAEKDPTIYTVGHTHIDVAWLWPLEMTEDKTVRSFSTVLELMRLYPEYRFMSSQPQLYAYVEEHAPTMFEAIRERIAEGRWEVEGGMWIEADCNISSGEALARQLLYGKRYFRERFGQETRILWLPDVFGYSAALPQLMKLAESDYFMTTKISWNERNKLPVDTFMWEGIDGTQVLTHFSPPVDYNALADFFPNVVKGYTTYNAALTAAQVLGSWQRYQQKDLNKEALMLVGHGDGGGGTTPEMLENGRRFAQGLPAAPRTEFTSARAFFERLEANVAGKKELPIWEGELYLEFHRGTYTSMARNKRWNRQSEFAYQGSEKLRVLAEQLYGLSYPSEGLHQGWLILLRNQFHDILPGTSIREVYRDSDREYADVFAYAEQVTTEALDGLYARLADDPLQVLLTNTQSFPRSEWLTLEAPGPGEWTLVAADGQGHDTPIPAQTTSDGQLLLRTPTVPAHGYLLCRFEPLETGTSTAADVPSWDPQQPVLENEHLRLVFNTEGRLRSFYDKHAQREILQPGTVGNDLVSFEDKPVHYDAWDITDYYTEQAWPVQAPIQMELVEHGPQRQVLKLVFADPQFRITEWVELYADSPRVDLRFEVDWQPTQQLLKLFFPLDINGHMATYEIQYGSVTRAMHRNTSWDEARFEVANQKWLDISENNYGVSFINDSKYGSGLHQGVLGLTLLKSPIWPNEIADQEVHHFSYSIRPHTGDWREQDIVRASYAYNNPLLVTQDAGHSGFYEHLPAELDQARADQRIAQRANASEPAQAQPSNTSPLSPRYSLLGSDDPNVIIEAVKQAEDGEGIVIRLYEAFGRRGRVRVNNALPHTSIREVNLLEHDAALASTELESDAEGFSFLLKPYEIKSFRLS